MYTTIGTGINPDNEGTITVRMVDLDQRERSSFEVIDSIRAELADYPGLQISITGEKSEGGGAPIEISISGSDGPVATAIIDG